MVRYMIEDIDGHPMVITPEDVIDDYVNRIRQRMGGALDPDDINFWVVQWSAALIKLDAHDALQKYAGGEVSVLKENDGVQGVDKPGFDQPCWIAVFRTLRASQYVPS